MSSPAPAAQVVASPLLLEVKGLVKDFPGQNRHDPAKRIIEGVRFKVEKGRAYGLMGLSGAGKSTLVGMLAGLMAPTRGDILLRGKKVSAAGLRRNVALAQGTDKGFYGKLSLVENLVFFGVMGGLSKPEAKQRSAVVLRTVGLSAHASETDFSKLSSGMKRQAHLARALLFKRPLLIVDEPTRGLDPVTEQHILEQLLKIKKGGQTMFVVTHDVHLAATLCDWIGILESGHLIRQGTPDTLLHLLRSTRIYMRFHDNPAEAVLRFEKLEALTELHTHDNEVHLYTQDPERDLTSVVNILAEVGIPIAHIDLPEPSLEEVFLKVIAERKHEQELKKKGGAPGAPAAAATVESPPPTPAAGVPK